MCKPHEGTLVSATPLLSKCERRVNRYFDLEKLSGQEITSPTQFCQDLLPILLASPHGQSLSPRRIKRASTPGSRPRKSMYCCITSRDPPRDNTFWRNIDPLAEVNPPDSFM